MKKIILIVAVAFGVANTAQAQDNKTDFRENFMFGLKAGVNYSNVYDSEGEEFEADGKFGAAAGAFLVIPIGKFVGIQPEVLFSQKGFQASGVLLGNRYNFKRTTNYIDVPLFFSIKPSEFFTIHLGPQFSYLIKQTDVFKTGSVDVNQQTEFENDNVRKNTLCLVAGADINMKHITLGLRAGYDLQNNKGDGTNSTPRYKNAWYQFTIGYRFYKA